MNTKQQMLNFRDDISLAGYKLIDILEGKKISNYMNNSELDSMKHTAYRLINISEDIYNSIYSCKGEKCMRKVIRASKNHEDWWRRYFDLNYEEREDNYTVDDPEFRSYKLKHVAWLDPKDDFEALWSLGDIELAKDTRTGSLIPVQLAGRRVYDVEEDTVEEIVNK